jgi:hypothetical protein
MKHDVQTPPILANDTFQNDAHHPQHCLFLMHIDKWEDWHVSYQLPSGSTEGFQEDQKADQPELPSRHYLHLFTHVN